MKMKRIIAIILTITLLSSSISQLQEVKSFTYEEGYSYLREIDEDKWITSGIYQYGIVDEEKKHAILYRISSEETNIVIPEAIDGYTVKYLGCCSTSVVEEPYGEEFCVIKNRQIIQRLEIPKTVTHIGTGAFANCINLKEVKFPKTAYLQIQSAAFGKCDKIKKISLWSADVRRYVGAVFTAQLERLELNNTELVRDEDEMYWGKVKTIVLNDSSSCRISDFEKSVENVYVNDDSTIYTFEWDPVNLYVNGKNAKVEIGSISDKTILYTIPSQKNAIKAFRKQCLTYHIKSTDSMKKLTCKKNGKKYRYAWKKIKTTIKTYKYNWDKNKWKKTKKNIATQYQIYGKEKKDDKYQLIKTTKKRKITTKYKYVKVKPVKIWLE